jgi:hypothetical protein
VNPRARSGDVSVGVARRVRILGELEPRKPERARGIPANPRVVLADASGEHDRVHTPENARHRSQGPANGEHEPLVGEPRARRAVVRGLEDLSQISGDPGHAAKSGTLRQSLAELVDTHFAVLLEVQQNPRIDRARARGHHQALER